MQTLIVLLRGVNVGGKNPVPMGLLRDVLHELGFARVETYIASGNVLLDSDRPVAEVERLVETALSAHFRLDATLIEALALSAEHLQRIVDGKPPGFGDQPELYHSDVIFLIGIDAAEAMGAFNPREGVDRVWPGEGVIYSQRLSAQRSRSRLSTIVASPLYRAMTIRNWTTTTRLLAMARARAVSGSDH